MSGNLREVFAAARQAQTEIDEPVAKPEPPSKRRAVAKPAKVAKPIAKSVDPNYQQLKVYVLADLRRKAQRKFEDQGGRDLSDLVERLLTDYLGS